MVYSTARTIGGKTGLVRSGTMTPIVKDRLVLRPTAMELRREGTDSAILKILGPTFADTSGRVCGLSTRETVEGWTPARFAISLIPETVLRICLERIGY